MTHKYAHAFDVVKSMIAGTPMPEAEAAELPEAFEEGGAGPVTTVVVTSNGSPYISMPAGVPLPSIWATAPPIRPACHACNGAGYVCSPDGQTVSFWPCAACGNPHNKPRPTP